MSRIITETTDAPITTATPYALAPGESFLGTLDPAGDRDWVAVTLDGQRSYTFHMMGQATDQGTLRDPILRLYEPTGTTVVRTNDDSGVGLDSRLSFTPEIGGTYFLAAADYRDNETGTYTLWVTTENTDAAVRGSGTTAGDAPVLAGGHDRYGGLEGDDTLHGRFGNDTLYGNAGNDLVTGGAGFDLLYGGEGTDTIFGGDGRDTAYMGDGDDLFNDNAQGGWLGQDTVYAGDGNDTIEGGNGDDRFYGGAGNDLIPGRLGDDQLFGDTGNDTLLGGAGNDSLYGGQGSNQLSGGLGDDFARLAGAGSHYTDDDGSGQGGSDTVLGYHGDDTIDTGDDADRVLGGNGADSLTGGDGDDSIFGGAHADTIVAGDGNDSVFGGQGTDRVFLGAGDDTFIDTNQTGALGNDTITGGAGADIFNFTGGAIAQEVITDFNSTEDSLELSASLVGTRTATQVVTDFGTVTAAGVLLDFGAGQSILLQGLTTIAGLDAAIDVEVLLNGGSAPENLIGSAGNDVIDGGGGDDTLRSLNSNDQLQLDSTLTGARDAAQVVTDFATAVAGGTLLDFGNGDSIFLEKWTNLSSLPDEITIV